MRKSDKKIENQIRDVLNDVCEDTLKSFDGFLWVTHSVNFSSFPQSLKIVCVFDTNQDRTNFLNGEGQQSVSAAIQQAFNQVGIQLKNIDKHISYDTQENCDRDHQGKWNKRL
ncbi:Fis family transcriptional regulator [Vibrio cyclitrophicus]